MNDYSTKNKNLSIGIRILIVCLALSSPLGILQIDGYSIFFIMGIITIIFLFIFQSTIKIDKLFLLYVLLLLGTTFYAYTNPINSAWMHRASKGFISILIITLVYFLISGVSSHKDIIREFRKGIIWAININIFWAILQVLFYRMKGININQLIFVDTLHTTENIGKFVKGTTLVASGLHWHPANLAPLLVLGLLLNKKIWYKAIIILVTVLTFSSTAILGVIVCVGLQFIFNSHTYVKTFKNKRITIKNVLELFAGTVLLAVVVIVFIKFNFKEQIVDVITNLSAKLNVSGTTDASANAHMDYYRYLPKILRDTPILKVILGYGYGCSGYVYSMLLGQYTFLDTWAVESDIINNILGMGILNSLVIYTWIVRIGIKGFKIDYRYLIFVVVILIQGVTYNIQFDWIILLLCVMAASIKNNINFFSDRNLK